MVSFQISTDPETILGDAIGDWLRGLEQWCIIFNDFCIVFFKIMKYIYAFILLCIGILTLLKLRGIYLKIRTNNIEDDEDRLKMFRLTLGCFYIVFSLGIIFNFFIYFLIWILDPIPDGFLFSFINFYGGIEPEQMNRIQDISASVYPHEKTIYYVISYCSMFSIITITLSVWYLINSNRLINNPKVTFGFLINGLIGGLLAGFTTCLPLFL